MDSILLPAHAAYESQVIHVFGYNNHIHRHRRSLLRVPQDRQADQAWHVCAADTGDGGAERVCGCVGWLLPLGIRTGTFSLCMQNGNKNPQVRGFCMPYVGNTAQHSAVLSITQQHGWHHSNVVHDSGIACRLSAKGMSFEQGTYGSNTHPYLQLHQSCSLIMCCMAQ